MSDLTARQRLDTPRVSRRRFAPNVDAEAVGKFSESIARFLGTGRYLAMQTDPRDRLDHPESVCREDCGGIRIRSSCSISPSPRRRPMRRR